jgi:hypothetical protein
MDAVVEIPMIQVLERAQQVKMLSLNPYFGFPCPGLFQRFSDFPLIGLNKLVQE